MSKFNKWVGLVVLLLLLLGTVGVVYADEESHVYGLVFMDYNLNGVWDVGEPGVAGVTVTLVSGETEITLESASGDPCTYQDEDVPTQCAGTFGINPAGEPGTTWTVSVTAPAGHSVTSANPQEKYIQDGVDASSGLSGVLQFGLAGGAGGAALPGAGGVAYGLYAVAMLLVGGVSVAVGSRIRK